MFNGFDASLFDDPDFKEDSVREEIVVPILRRLGYSASGPNKIVRSKGLLHPFVMIGSKKHPVYIIPDYLLHSDGRPGLVLDAKSPDAELVNSKHAEQAYSYAIHPDVRVRFYALCSGKRLVAYDIYGTGPIFDIEFSDFDRKWDVIKSVLDPKNVSFAFNQYLAPDFGVAVVNSGTDIGTQYIFQFTRMSQFCWIGGDLFTISVGMPVGGVYHFVSIDADKSAFDKILQLTDRENRDEIYSRLKPGKGVLSERPIYATLDTRIGQPTRGEHDTFIPFIVADVIPLDEAAFLAAEAIADAAQSTEHIKD
jgi:hypothetical protein